MDRDTVEKDVQIEPTLFCAMRYINDARSLPWYKTQIWSMWVMCAETEQFFRAYSLDKSAPFQNYQVLGVPASRNIHLANSSTEPMVTPKIKVLTN